MQSLQSTCHREFPQQSQRFFETEIVPDDYLFHVKFQRLF